MKPKLLFVYDMSQNMVPMWKDGLWAALNLLEEDFEIEKYNINDPMTMTRQSLSDDFILGWGAFDSKVDKWMDETYTPWKKGLCLAAHYPVNETAKNYDIIFYETEATRRWLETENLTNLKHAFGVNTDVYKPLEWQPDPIEEYHLSTVKYPKIWDEITVGSWSKWHRQDKLMGRPGNNLAVGYIQRENIQESANLFLNALLNGNYMVSDMVKPERLAQLYNMSKKCYCPADFGQERSVLEARACGLEVIVEDDNPKLKELLTSPIWDHRYYYEQLRDGILGVLK